MSEIEWRWADPSGQQRRIRLDELRAALAGGLVAPNAPVWRAGWDGWRAAREIPELQSSALSAENGLLPNIPPPPLAVVAAQSAYESKAAGAIATVAEPPPPPRYVPMAPPTPRPSPSYAALAATPAPVNAVPAASSSPMAAPAPAASSSPMVAPAAAPSAVAKVVAASENARGPFAPIGNPGASTPTQVGSPAFVPPAEKGAAAKAKNDQKNELSWSEPPPPTNPAPQVVEELSSSMLEVADDTGMLVALSPAMADKVTSAPPLPPRGSTPPPPLAQVGQASARPSHAPPLPVEARAAQVRGSTPPPPHVRASTPPPPLVTSTSPTRSLKAVRPSESPPATASVPPPGPRLVEEMSSSSLVLDDSGAYRSIMPRTPREAKTVIGHSAPPPPVPKFPSMPPPSPTSPSVRPPPLVPPEELSSSMLETADDTGAFTPIEELSSSVLEVADPTGAFPAQGAGASAAARPMATMLGGIAPFKPGSSASSSVAPSPAPELPPPAAPAAAAPAPVPEPAPAPAAPAASAPVPTSLFGSPSPVAAPAAANVSVPTSLFGSPSPVAAPAPAAPASAAASEVDPLGKTEAASPGSVPPPRLSVNTSIGLGTTPPVDVAPHPVVVPPPAQSPQSQVAGYFERADLHSVRPPAPDAGSVQTAEKEAAPRASVPSAGDVDLGSALPPSPLDKVKVALAPLVAKGRELSAKNRLFLPVAGVVGASFAVLFVAVLVKACGSDSSPAKTAASASASASGGSASASSGSASALASAVPTASSTSVTSASASAAAVEAPTIAAAKVACKLEGVQVSLAEKAVVSAGAEVLAKDDVLAVGFAKGPKEGEMIKLGEGLAPSPPVKLRMGDPLRRVQPVLRRGRLELAVEIDRKVSGLSSRRVVAFDPPFDVGVNERGLGYGPHGKGATKDLFALDGEGTIEALRVAPIPGKKGVAVAFRRSGAVHAGVAEGDELAPRGTLQRVPGLGAQVGSPTIAVSGDSYLVAFADRAAADAPWSLRTFGGKVGADASAAKTFEVPKGGPGGGVISPSLSPIDGGFLLVWTEGPENAHQVRAQALDLEGNPSGEPMGISTSGVNAGQGRAAVNAAGQGVVVYFASKESGFELMGAKVACTKGSP